MKVGVGVNAHSVTDHTQSNWNGLVGQLRLRVSDRIWIDDLQIYPDAASFTLAERLAGAAVAS